MEQVLCRSARFTVGNDWETVLLEGGGAPRGLVIGEFHGDPLDAAIDPPEEWCVVVGEGLIAYRLAPPWVAYRRPVSVLRVDDPVELKRAVLHPRWFEWGRRRDGPPHVWIERVVALGEGAFLGVGEPDREGLVTEYLIEPGSERVTPGRRRPPA